MNLINIRQMSWQTHNLNYCQTIHFTEYFICKTLDKCHLQFSYLLPLKFPLLPSFVKESNSVCHLISSIFDKCPERLIMSIMAKPYIVQNISFHWICSKFHHGHNCFWTPTLWRVLEDKNISQRPKICMKELIYWEKS